MSLPLGFIAPCMPTQAPHPPAGARWASRNQARRLPRHLRGAPVPAEAPALALAVENATADTTGEGGGATPSNSRKHEAKTDAKEPKPEAVHENVPRHRPGKTTTKVRASKRKAAGPGKHAAHINILLSPAKAVPAAPRLEGRLLHPESLAANPRAAGELRGHAIGVLWAKTEHRHKVEGTDRMKVNTGGPAEWRT